MPMKLMGDLYAEEYGHFTPPDGHVVMLWPGRAGRYLTGLVDPGLVVLRENLGVASAPLVGVQGTES